MIAPSFQGYITWSKEKSYHLELLNVLYSVHFGFFLTLCNVKLFTLRILHKVFFYKIWCVAYTKNYAHIISLTWVQQSTVKVVIYAGGLVPVCDFYIQTISIGIKVVWDTCQ